MGDGEFPALGTEQVLKAFPDIDTGPVLKAFPDIDVGQVLKVHRDDLGEPHAEGELLTVVILGPLAGTEGVRVGAVYDASQYVDESVMEQPETLGALDVSVLDGESDWAVIVSVTDVRESRHD